MPVDHESLHCGRMNSLWKQDRDVRIRETERKGERLEILGVLIPEDAGGKWCEAKRPE